MIAICLYCSRSVATQKDGAFIKRMLDTINTKVKCIATSHFWKKSKAGEEYEK